MAGKAIDLNKSVYDLCNEHKELPQLLHDLGFVDIIKPGMLHTAGRFMTLKKGAAFKKVSLDLIKETLAANGYEIID